MCQTASAGSAASNSSSSLIGSGNQDHSPAHLGVAQPEYLAGPEPQLCGKLDFLPLKFEEQCFPAGFYNTANNLVELQAEFSANGLLNGNQPTLEVDRQRFAAGNAQRLRPRQHLEPTD
jgi:hypothetical protein